MIKQTVQTYVPWLLLEFAALLGSDPASKPGIASNLSLEGLPQFIDQLIHKL